MGTRPHRLWSIAPSCGGTGQAVPGIAAGAILLATQAPVLVRPWVAGPGLLCVADFAAAPAILRPAAAAAPAVAVPSGITAVAISAAPAAAALAAVPAAALAVAVVPPEAVPVEEALAAAGEEASADPAEDAVEDLAEDADLLFFEYPGQKPLSGIFLLDMTI